jgi:elongation factor P--(R)-beta-lysine ligase
MSPGSNHSPHHDASWRLASKGPALRLRARVIRAIRRFFTEREYLEVETPCLIPAPAPEPHIDAIPAGELFLQTSPELCMKRLLAAGYPRLFQICRCFRMGERGSRHLPEFTMLEWYGSGMDYRNLMSDCESLLRFISIDLGLGEKIRYQGVEISLGLPWERISVREAFERYSSLGSLEAVRAGRFDEIMVTDIEPRLGLGTPTFLYDYPTELAALSRVKEDDPSVAERFELYVARLEIANGFSELTDAGEQRERFLRDREERRRSGKIVYPLPEKFLDSLPEMPNAAGIALGVDRLVMLLADRTDIRDVVSFTPEEL